MAVQSSTGTLDMARHTSAFQRRFIVVDDHEAVLSGTVPALQNHYPQSIIETAQTLNDAFRILGTQPNWDLVVVDLSIPKNKGESASPRFGIELLKSLLESKMAPNILVLSTDTKPITRLKSCINGYEGGFVVMDKSQSLDEMLQMAGFSLRGSVYWPKASSGVGSTVPKEFDHRWIKVLTLKFEEGLTDKAIATELQVSDRTIRNYWIRLQDSLGIPSDPKRDVRIQIWNTARELGLVD